MIVMITERQKQVLDSIITEYVDSAQPVSSHLLEKKHDFGVCPATIRIEMQKLTDAGFLCQPHTSAGRVPTDKGYRFFVDELLKEELGGLEEDLGIDWEEEMEDSFKFAQVITKFLASESSNLALGYLLNEKILWKEGWKEILQEPEFIEAGQAARFAQMLDEFEKNVEDFAFSLPMEIQVFIGKENPVSRVKDFSIITSKLIFPDYQGVFAILGPKRMSYSKNIYLLQTLNNLLK